MEELDVAGSHRLPPCRWRALMLLALAGLVVAFAAAAPAAEAYRAPSRAEQAGVTHAWTKKHGKQARGLSIEQVRVSTRDSRFVAVLYGVVAPGPDGKPQVVSDTKIDYFKRVNRGHASDRSVHSSSVKSIVEDFEYLGQNVPKRVRDDDDPLYRVSYFTTQDERISRTINWTCEDGSQVTTHSTGDYRWTVTFSRVPITRADFTINNPQGFLQGSESFEWGCPPGPGAQDICHTSRTIHWSNSPHNSISRTNGSGLGRFLHLGYVRLTPGQRNDVTDCALIDAEASPIPIVEIRQRHFFYGLFSPPDSASENIDSSDFAAGTLINRLGNCEVQSDVGETSCSESVDGFAAKVTLQRQRR